VTTKYTSDYVTVAILMSTVSERRKCHVVRHDSVLQQLLREGFRIVHDFLTRKTLVRIRQVTGERVSLSLPHTHTHSTDPSSETVEKSAAPLRPTMGRLPGGVWKTGGENRAYRSVRRHTVSTSSNARKMSIFDGPPDESIANERTKTIVPAVRNACVCVCVCAGVHRQWRPPVSNFASAPLWPTRY